MKKLSLHFLGMLLLTFARVPSASAVGLEDFKDQALRPDNLSDLPGGDVSPESLLTRIFQFGTDLILYASGSIAVLMLVVGGIMYITAFGEQERIDSAKKIIKFALIGLIIVILAYAIVTNVIDLIYKTTS